MWLYQQLLWGESDYYCNDSTYLAVLVVTVTLVRPWEMCRCKFVNIQTHLMTLNLSINSVTNLCIILVGPYSVRSNLSNLSRPNDSSKLMVHIVVPIFLCFKLVYNTTVINWSHALLVCLDTIISKLYMYCIMLRNIVFSFLHSTWHVLQQQRKSLHNCSKSALNYW